MKVNTLFAIVIFFYCFCYITTIPHMFYNIVVPFILILYNRFSNQSGFTIKTKVS